mgnify:FL=1
MKINTRNLITAAVVGALYAVLTMVLAPISYGALQFRVSEVLCILPFFMPSTAWGLFVGCIVANLMSTAGVLDVVFGSLATLITCLCIARCGKMGNTLKARLLACFMPVIWNGLIVGATLTIALAGLNPLTHFGAFLVFAGEVALGELGVMYLIGLPLMTYLPKQRFFSEFVDKHS